MAGSVAYQAGRARSGGPWPADEAREWIAQAKSSQALARSTGQGVRVEDLCGLATQAVERAVRAVLIVEGIPVPEEESVRAMLAALDLHGIAVPERIARAADACAEDGGPIHVGKYYEAVMIAGEAIRFAESRVGRR